MAAKHISIHSRIRFLEFDSELDFWDQSEDGSTKRTLPLKRATFLMKSIATGIKRYGFIFTRLFLS